MVVPITLMMKIALKFKNEHLGENGEIAGEQL